MMRNMNEYLSHSNMSLPCIARSCRPSTTDALLPLLRRLTATSKSPSAPFSTTSSLSYPRDNNHRRGVSAVRRTGLRPRQTISVKDEPLPKPVLDPEKRSKPTVDEDHGLWGFLNKEKRILATPEEDGAFGVFCWCRAGMFVLTLL